MKIIEDNYNSATPCQQENILDICEHCESKFSYDSNDIIYAEFGCAAVVCPCCGKITYLSDKDNLHLTSDNILFPEHFHHSVANNVLDNDYITERIRQGLIQLDNNPCNTFWCYESGTIFIMIKKFVDDNDYQIVVAHGYYTTSLDC